MTPVTHTIRWTETAVGMAQAVSDARRAIVLRVETLAHTPEQQGKLLTGELAGFRSLRAAGQRFRIIYQVHREEVIVPIVAVGRRRAGDRSDIHELARRLLRQGLLR